MQVEVITDPEFCASIKAKSVHVPERDLGGIECWREGKTAEHYFLGDAYWHTIESMPTGDIK